MKETNTTPEESQKTSADLREWPGAFGIYNSSRDAVRQNIGTLIALWLIPVAASIFLDIVLTSRAHESFAAMLARQLVVWGLGVYLAVAQTYVYISAARHKRVELNEAFRIVPPLFWRMLLLNLLIIISVVAGLILLIVPGIIVAMRLSLAPYYLVDQNLSVMQAYKASWNATKGNLGKLWGMVGVSLLMLLPVITIIGIVASIYLLLMYSAAVAFLYLHLLHKTGDSPAQD